MPTDIRYDPAGRRSATTNRLDPKLATRMTREAGALADCAIAISGADGDTTRTLTLQFKDSLYRNYCGFVTFEIHQVNGALGSALVSSSGGINPVFTTGQALREIVAVTSYLCQTNGDGLAVLAIDQNSGTAQSFSILCGGLMFSTGVITWT